MFSRALRLYRRYVTRHLTLTLDRSATTRLVLRAGRLWLEGRGSGALEHGGTQTSGALPLSLPFAKTSLTRFRSATARPVTVPALSRLSLFVAETRLWPTLLRRILRALPLLARRNRAAAKRALGFDAMPPAPDLRPLPAPEPLPKPGPEIAILLPIHNAYAALCACLERLRPHTDLPWRLVLVDDGSTDARLTPLLTHWAKDPRVTLIRHETPQGFAGAINAGLAAITGFDGPVVLLNSDVTLPDGWASRLIAPLLSDGSIASVTPLSNVGELMGAPGICGEVALRNHEVDAIDAALAPLAQSSDLPVLPTSTGFCMALSPDFLSLVPRLDDSFGRGYGEEVDWCQRTRALGGRHVCQTGLYVGHEGAASFGRETRAELRAQAAPILNRRYPKFEGEVQAILDADPLAAERLRAGMLWARARLGEKALPVYLGHSLGGGAEMWLKDQVARDVASLGAAVVVRVGTARRWGLELHFPGGVTRGGTDSFADLRRLLDFGGARNVIYSCGVGDADPETLPQHLLALCAGGQGLEVLFHDYFPLSRDFRLLRSETDPDWAALWRPVLERAGNLVVFSEASRAVVAKAHSDLDTKITLRPHAPRHPIPHLAPVRGRGGCVVGVPGNLSGPKGAAVVAELARVFARTGEARIVVFGEVTPDVSLPRSVRVLGGYEIADFADLAVRENIGCWLIPSLWAETFSYTTQEALMTGLPCFGFAIGAQGEALTKAARLRGQGAAVALRPSERAAWFRSETLPEASNLLTALRDQPGWPKTEARTGARGWRWWRVPV